MRLLLERTDLTTRVASTSGLDSVETQEWQSVTRYRITHEARGTLDHITVQELRALRDLIDDELDVVDSEDASVGTSNDQE